jgi:Zn-dependent M28 family amino/carboxypeptidase
VLPETQRHVSLDRLRLQSWVELLASPSLRGRRTNTPEAGEVAGLLGRALDQLEIPAPPGGRCQPYPFMEGEDRNVIAHLAAEAGAPWILVAAHFDARGLLLSGRIVAGADDNASGVASVLEIARLASREKVLPNSVAFVLFGSEEFGSIGARAWLEHPSIPLADIRFMINLDMVGRPLPNGAPGIGYSFPDPEHTAVILPVLQRAALARGVELAPLTTWHESVELLSDSTIVAGRLPAVMLSTGLHSDHHTAGDTADRIDVSQIERSVELVLEVLKSKS